MTNKASSAKFQGPTVKCACLAVAAGLSLLSGCESMGPSKAYKPPLPSALTKQNKPPKEEPPPPAGETQNTTQAEVYPPSGALFGQPAAASKQATAKEGTARPPFHAKEGKYELNFEDADLAEVAKAIMGDILKVNYVINPKVTGKVSLQTTRKLADDEMIPTLEMLLKTNGAVLIHQNGLYRIEPEANGTINAPTGGLGLSGQSLPPGYQLRIVPLRYVGVTEMQKVIEPLMPPKSVIRAEESRNLLLLAGTSEELEGVLETIRIFDVDYMRGMSVGLFPLKNVEAQTVAEELDKLLTVSGKGPLGGMFRLMPIERLQAILVVTPQPRYLDEAQTWIERLDRYNPAKTGNMHVYHVQNVDALDLANTIGAIFGQSQGRSQTPGASLAPGLTGSSVGGGASAGYDGTGFGASSSGLGGGSSGFGGGSSSSTGLGGGTGGLGTSGSALGSSGSGSTGAGGIGSGTGATGGFGSSTGSGAGGSGFGSTGQGRARGSTTINLGNNMKVVADPANNALVIMAKPQEYREIETVIKQLDVMPLQVLIDATIVEVSLTGSLQYGVQWLFANGQNATALTSDSAFNKTLDSAIDVAGPAAAASTGGFAYALAGKNIKILVKALAKDNKANVISAPSLMVLNNQTANINVGDRVPISTGTSTNLNSGGTNPFITSTIQYVDTGVTLKVRPRVNAGGLVIMDIIQEISTPQLSDVDVGGAQQYKFLQRKIQSQVAVSNGDTLALGGLIQNKGSNAQNGIPYLNQIPWLGWLFGSTSIATDRTELVVLLTPRVVEKRQDVSTVTNEFRSKLTGLAGMFEQKQNPPPTDPEEQSRIITPPQAFPQEMPEEKTP